MFLDLNEINAVQYDIHIGAQPIIQGQEPALPDNEAGLSVLSMVNKFGQKYWCMLPHPSLEEEMDSSGKPENAAEKDEQNVTKNDNSTVGNVGKIRQLLEPMSAQPCLLRTKDWWTYEFCYGRTVRQYHMEEGKPNGPVMILGFYDHDLEWLDENKSGVPVKDETLPRPSKHHSQLYTNGSTCDLTGNLRQTEVRFECDPTSVVDVISRVTEPTSCEYVIIVSTSRICAIPHFRPPPAKKPFKIECQPLLTQSEYDAYEQLKVQHEKLAEEKVKENVKQQKEHFLKVLDGEDLSKIDMDSEEGMQLLEGMVGEKMADKLVAELGLLLMPSSSAPSSNNVVQMKHNLWVKDVTLKNGKSFTKILKKNTFLDLIQEYMLNKGQLKKKEEKVVNLDPRSDLSDEDAMMEHLVDTVKKMTSEEKESLGDLKNAIKKNVQDSIEDILEETEGEMDLKLDSLERHNAIEELSKTLGELMNKLDKAEADINRVNSEINQLQGTILDREDELDKVHKDDLEEDEKEEEEEGEEQSRVNIKVTNFSPSAVSGLKDSASEQRVVKHLENAIKDKLAKSGLDTGGRQIEVKLVTATIPNAAHNDADTFVDLQRDQYATAEEAKQFQHMIYNLMVGNQEAYEDIDRQRKTERNYNFRIDPTASSSNDVDNVEKDLKSEPETEATNSQPDVED